MEEYIFVNRKSKPHLRRKAKDHGAPPEELHPNKLRSRLQFARSAHRHYGQQYPKFIRGVKTDLAEERIRPPAPVPVISERDRSRLMCDAVNRGASPEIIDAVAEVVRPSPIEILMPELRRGRAKHAEALFVIMPGR